MLKLAKSYEASLNLEWERMAFNPKYKYLFSGSGWTYNVTIDNSSTNRIQMVSVDSEDDIIGLFSASVDREAKIIDGLTIVNFRDSNITFSRDMYKFLSDLFRVHRFRKIEWYVFVGNPAEKMYDKIVKKYGGRIAGYRLETCVGFDGEYRDMKMYEIFKRDYDNYIKGGRKSMITAQSVWDVFSDCLFDEDEEAELPTGEYIVVDGIGCRLYFKRSEIENRRKDISLLVDAVIDPNGGLTCRYQDLQFDKNGIEWGSEDDAKRLMFLGIAIGRIRYTPAKYKHGRRNTSDHQITFIDDATAVRTLTIV
ncbi:MAG: GNAT family protein [Herbinix sp.]|nr:GNAT family protein [Herbinix sp.]